MLGRMQSWSRNAARIVTSWSELMQRGVAPAVEKKPDDGFGESTSDHLPAGKPLGFVRAVECLRKTLKGT
jgi:hypothetical protein